MRFDEDHDSPDIIDRRGDPSYSGGGSRRRAGMGGGIFNLLMPIVRSRFGMTGVAVLAVGYFGLQMFTGGSSSSSARRRMNQAAPTRTKTTGKPDRQKAFIGFVLDDVQNLWTRKYPGPGAYRRAKLVLFTGATDTACGLGESATGPFYCPGDERAYIDLSFFKTLSKRLGAPGDFAQAYVLAHEIGHHVQKLTGASRRVHAAPKSQQKGAQGLSVRLELQADCYAGVWANGTKQQGLIEAGDLEEALTAAEAIGDDTLQRNATGRVRPETFSHGSSAQRMKWFKRGFTSGDPADCDTFSGRI